MRATLSKTKFKDAPIVPVAAKPATAADEKESSPIGECPLILSHKYQITAQSFHPKKGYATDNFFSRYHWSDWDFEADDLSAGTFGQGLVPDGRGSLLSHQRPGYRHDWNNTPRISGSQRCKSSNKMMTLKFCVWREDLSSINFTLTKKWQEVLCIFINWKLNSIPNRVFLECWDFCVERNSKSQIHSNVQEVGQQSYTGGISIKAHTCNLSIIFK